MEGKNLESVKNTADNFKSILPKDKLSGQDIKNFTKSLFKINDNSLSQLLISNSAVNSVSNQSALFNQKLNTKLNTLSQDPNIEYADPNGYAYMQKTPNDSRYEEQWSYYEKTGGINLPEAWDISTGSKDIVIGVVDTGIVKHENLAGKILPGQNFVPDKNDPNDKDDPTDHGGETSYHGTHVAGTAAAVSDQNGVVSGVAWGAKILPVRVLDENGAGSFATILKGIRWAAGLTGNNTKSRANKNPAKVINLSLGGIGKCSPSTQETINAINAKGATVVVAAGNSSIPAALFTPANCLGVITVGATDRDGKQTSYTNYGKKLTIAAPGGDSDDKKDKDTNKKKKRSISKNESNTILSLAGPGEYQFLEGTSMAAPHVTGVVALMYSLNNKLTHKEVVKYLQDGARGNVMGVGLLDAKKTLELVQGEESEETPEDD
jgi:serine protease